MRAGILNTRIKIQQRVTGQSDSFGQPITTWMDVVAVWANLRYLNGKEYLTSGTEVSAAAVSVRIRYRKDITADMRVLLDGRILNIKAVLPDASGRDHVDLVCETAANDG